VADPDENYILLEAIIAGKSCILGSVYGPNSTNRQFFINLERDIQSFNAEFSVIAGDWNCTFSYDEIPINIDCLNMVSLPNRTHSLILNEMCDRLNLTDPYRALNPTKKEIHLYSKINKLKKPFTN
jgi:hypothetical protein